MKTEDLINTFNNLSRWFNIDSKPHYIIKQQNDDNNRYTAEPLKKAKGGEVFGKVVLSILGFVPTLIAYCTLLGVKTSLEKRGITHASLWAQQWLKAKIKPLGGTVEYISPPASSSSPTFQTTNIEKNVLDPDVFTWDNVYKVQEAMAKDATNPNHIALYGAASQYNGGESMTRIPIARGEAEKMLQEDMTQGPAVQRMYPIDQVEAINSAIYEGMNALASVLSDKSKGSLVGGYLTPKSNDEALAIIEDLKNHGSKAQFTCVGNTLREVQGEERNQPVYSMFHSTVALGGYLNRADVSHENQKELAFQATLISYRALFQEALLLKEKNPEKDIVVKPAALGLGAFGNAPEAVAKAYFTAATEFQNELKEKGIKGIKVILQVRVGKGNNKGDAHEMATRLGLENFTEQEAKIKFEAFTNQKLKEAAIEKIGDHAMIVRKADSKIQELFDWLIKEGVHEPSLTVILNIETGIIDQVSKTSDKNDSEQLKKMQELAPTLLAYFNQVITKHPGHNKMAISFDWKEKRGTTFGFHQDGGASNIRLNPLDHKGVVDTTDAANSPQWKIGTYHQEEGLLFAYKKPENGPILPTTVANLMEKTTELMSDIVFTQEELTTMYQEGRLWCSPIEEENIVVLNNRTAYHATTSYDVAEIAYGKGSGDNFFDPQDHSNLNDKTKHSLLLRIGCSTFKG
jgi:hypothetical protein